MGEYCVSEMSEMCCVFRRVRDVCPRCGMGEYCVSEMSEM